VKHVLERGAIVTGAARVARQRRLGDVLILAYHNIVPDGEPIAGDQSLHLPQRTFGWQLDQLIRTHTVVSLDDMLHQRSAPSNRPAVVITFDDAYRGTVTAGVHELHTRNLPATIFVPPAYLGGHTFWWDVLTPITDSSLAPHIRDHALEAEQGEEANILAWASRTKLPTSAMPWHATAASEAELAIALEHPGLTLGSHTWSHPNLVELTPAKLMRELQSSQQWLAEHFGTRTVPVISYPYGRADERVWHAARDAGYEAGVMIDGGWITHPIDQRYALPRLNIPAGVTSDGFVLRTSGLITA
jgi:peptidoglycan/xylan/chitin deacetylase (PgdA/CDA1 family)